MQAPPLSPPEGKRRQNGRAEVITEVRRQEAALKAGALQSAIFNSANFSSIATDEKGVIQIFNVGAERMLGYAADDVLNKVTPADISDPQEVIARARALSQELGTTIAPGFEALVFKASRGIEDIYELTCTSARTAAGFPAVVSVTALRDVHDHGGIIGYLLIGTDNTARKQVEEEQKKLDQRLRDQQFYTRSLIESNVDALMTTDPHGIITDVNKQMEALTELLARRADRLALQKLFHRPRARRGRHQPRAAGEEGHRLPSSPRGRWMARRPWCPTTPPPSTTGTGSCRGCSPQRATSRSESASSGRSRKRTSTWRSPSRPPRRPTSPNRISFPA